MTTREAVGRLNGIHSERVSEAIRRIGEAAEKACGTLVRFVQAAKRAGMAR